MTIPGAFSAYRVRQEDGQVRGRLEKISLTDLGPGEVIVRIEYSGVNFKDALGPTSRGKIQRRFPLVVGIDLAGTVVESASPRFHAGQGVCANGCDLGEKIDGGFSQYARVPAAILMPLPRGLSALDAMTLGTAGFTAALARHRMEENGQSPEKGPILVTGASGGVGAVAVDLFANAGYAVVAVSGKPEAKKFLEARGAREIIAPEALKLGTNPLERIRWAGAIDNVGGELLAGVLRHIELWGNVASIGLAGGAELHTTVMPHILRGVSLLGISSNNCPMPLREKLWGKLATDWRPRELASLRYALVSLRELDEAFRAILDRKVVGRIVVACQE